MDYLMVKGYVDPRLQNYWRGVLVPVPTPMHSLTEYTISLQVLSRQEI